MMELKMIRCTAAVLAFALLGGAALPPERSAARPAAGPLSAAEAERFADTFFGRPEVKEQLAGAVITVVKDDEVLLKKGYGYADVLQKQPVDPEETVFRVASISKVITATAVMQLAEQGKIDLNGDVSPYLGDLQIPNETGTPLTMRDLLTNSTGFEYGDTPAVSTTDLTLEIPLRQYVKDYAPAVTRQPGAFFRYDNLGFTIQGYAVEHVSVRPFGEYVRERIFQPLGMVHSEFRLTPQIRERLAVPYSGLGEEITPYATVPTELPGGGMLSTGADMARFMMAHLGGGSLGTARILKAETLSEMLKPQLAIHAKLPNMAYGFEFSNQQIYNGQYVVEKSGDEEGYHSALWLLPMQKVGVFVAVNKDMELRKELFESFMDRFYPGGESSPAGGPFQPTQPSLERFAGMYGDLRNRMWTTRIRAEEGRLIVRDPLGEHVLYPVEPLLFRDEQGVRAAFKMNGRGEVTAFYSDAKSDSWAQKLPEPQPYTDVGADHPFAGYIGHLRQLGVFPGKKDGGEVFHPDRPITRGEFAAWLMGWSGIASSRKEPVFGDTAGSAYREQIQAAYEFGLIDGTGGAAFHPDRPITRQEAAVMTWRLARRYLHAVPKEARLSGKTDAWALEGVRFVAAKGLYGPEAIPDADGSLDYQSKRPMLRKEAAALLSRFADHLL
ncbi:serine hydrolase [Paenibacillus caseinilyticus]|uniref:Penicillin-binding protein n=1 Tax=Paenibacillus mucilaginosus K02 TaxID=997761 RepID=I0BH77_9BACL|nr:serine hydrolase [Paenibacillus mucilaginosus]AFH61724.1 penicillin-binding protein [Paenibacillus mucilaginosus K02]AFK65238.1 hypothetical protein [Paenibacillus mucilaginosus K02]